MKKLLLTVACLGVALSGLTAKASPYRCYYSYYQDYCWRHWHQWHHWHHGW